MWTLRAFALASHLAPTVVMTVAVTGLSWAVGWLAWQLVVGAGAVLTGQLSVGWSNDAHDAAVDRRAGRTDKPTVTAAVSSGALWRAAVIAAAMTVPLSWGAAGWLGGSFHLLGVGAAWVYNLALSRTVWSWLPYTVAFGCIAPFVTLGAPDSQAPAAWLVTALALLGVGAHAANALPDLQRDRAAGVGGLAPVAGRGWTLVLAASAVALATTMLAVAATASSPAASLVLVGALLAAGVGVALRPADDGAAFAAVMLLALMDVVVVVVAGVPLTG